MSQDFATPQSPPSLRITVVDDSDAVVAGICQFLITQPGMTVVATALSGPLAIAACRLHESDLVLLDVNMPEMNGLETAKLLHQAHPALPILLISVDDGESLASDSADLGVCGFLSKIGLQRTLLPTIRKLFPDREFHSVPPWGTSSKSSESAAPASTVIPIKRSAAQRSPS